MLPFAVSCANLPKPLAIDTSPTVIQRQIYPRPAPVATPDVRVKVLIDSGNAYFGFAADDYIDFAAWLENVTHFIKSQSAVIDAYEREAVNHNAERK